MGPFVDRPEVCSEGIWEMPVAQFCTQKLRGRLLVKVSVTLFIFANHWTASSVQNHTNTCISYQTLWLCSTLRGKCLPSHSAHLPTGGAPRDQTPRGGHAQAQDEGHEEAEETEAGGQRQRRSRGGRLWRHGFWLWRRLGWRLRRLVIQFFSPTTYLRKKKQWVK